MENSEITSHVKLKMRIMQLKQEAYDDEDELKYNIRVFAHTLNPVSLAKQSLRNLAEDSQVQYDMAKIGLNFGVNIVIGRILGKNSNIKGIVSAFLVEKLSDYFIHVKLPKIISDISRKIHR